MNYAWFDGKSDDIIKRALALERDIEALFKLYAKDRQGETEKMSVD